MPFDCLNPLTSNLALYLSMDLSIFFFFFLKLYLHPMGLEPGGKSTRIYVLLNIMDPISSSIASFQNVASLDFIASSMLEGSFSML
jgi:hypothetical protein